MSGPVEKGGCKESITEDFSPMLIFAITQLPALELTITNGTYTQGDSRIRTAILYDARIVNSTHTRTPTLKVSTHYLIFAAQKRFKFDAIRIVNLV